MASHRQRAGCIADALGIERGDLLLETARPQQEVLLRNASIREIKRTPFLTAHKGRRLANGEAGRITLDQNGTDAVETRTETNVHKVEFGITAVGPKYLLAVQDVVISLFAG